METTDAAHAFATLGHPDRLSVFRLLMRFAPRGVRPTEIAGALNLKPNTLSHHLADLSAAGLIRATRHGRSLHYSVDAAATEALVAYLALDVARGRPALVAPAPTADQPRHVLFLCTANSARSILAEALLRDLGQGRFIAHSAGLHPAHSPNPWALRTLERHRHATEGLSSKSADSLRGGGAPGMDFVFTVCDRAAAEECAPWPGQPASAHWGLPDPARAPDPEPAFEAAYATLRHRIAAFVALPFDRLDRPALQQRIDALSLEPQD